MGESKLKVVTRGARYPRKYKPIRSFYLCDLNGEIVARASFSITGLSISVLDGFRVNVKDMNGLGQFRLDDEPDAPFSCPHCGATSRKWVASGPYDASYRVVCKFCGKGVI